MGYMGGPVECQACGYRWVAVYPPEADEDALQCPACKQMAGRVVDMDESRQWRGLGLPCRAAG